MSKRRAPYPPEFRRQMVELARSGRTPEELSREFGPTAQSIRNWLAQDILSKATAWFARETNKIPGKDGSS